MPQTFAAMDAALKDEYLPGVRDQLNRDHIIKKFQKAHRDSVEWQGRQAIVVLRKGRNQGTKAMAESGFLPAAGAQSFAKLAIPIRRLTTRIELTLEVLEATRSDKGAYVRALADEMDGAVEDITRQRNRVLFGFGQGTLALVNGAVTTSATVVLDTPGGVVGAVNATRFLKAGQVIAFHDAVAPSTTVDAVGTISSVDSATQVTMSATLSADDNAPMTLGVNNGGTLQGSYGIEPMGLLGLIDSTTYVSTIHGLDRSQAANAFFRPVISASVGQLSEDVLDRGIDDVNELSGQTIDTFYCHHSVRREYRKLTIADRRYTGEDLKKPDAGVDMFKSNLIYAGQVEWQVVKDAPYGIILGVNNKHIYWLPENEGNWEDRDGAILSRVADKSNYEARFYVLENFYCDQGDAHVRFDGVTATVSSGVVSD